MPTQYGLYAACALAAANAGALVAVTEQVVKLQRKQDCINARHQAQIARQELAANQYLKRVTALETLETDSRCHAAIAAVRADNAEAMRLLKEKINRRLPSTIRNVMRDDNANALRQMNAQLSAYELRRNRNMEERIAALRADMLRHAATERALQRDRLES